MKKIICFDIDDCILSHYNILPKEHRFQIFKLNLERLVHLCQQTGAKLFMTSSWGMLFKLDNNGVILFKDEFDYGDEFEQKVTKIMNSYLQPYIIGVSCGDRREDIKNLLEQNYKVVAIDDMDLSNIKNNNYIYLNVETMISDKQIREIKRFLNG